MAKTIIGITHGDINGVGYEVILKTFQTEEMLSLCTPVVYGSPKVATYHRKAIDNQTNFVVKDSAAHLDYNAVNMINCFGEAELKVDLTRSSEESGNAAFVSLDRALDDYSKNGFDVLVTAPLNKSMIHQQGVNFTGQSDYIASKCGEGETPLNMLVYGTLRIALLTSNMPVSQVAQQITKESLVDKVKSLKHTLNRDFYIDNPRIAILSFNPRSTDGEEFGKEEKDIISPAIKELMDNGVRCFGPFAADELFASGSYSHFDAILAMYHDQGVAPFKAIAGEEGVCFTAGLDIVHTAPAHGVEYDKAGKGEKDESAFRNAVYMAIDIYRNRNRYDDAYAHPLRRQYYEKRDDSDKLKLDQVTEDEI